MDFVASAGSWLSNTPWLVPLGTIVAAGAAVMTAVIALFIGIQAGRVAGAQKEIAGLSEVTKLGERLNTMRYLTARKQVAYGYINGAMDAEGAYDLLDFMEESAIWQNNGYIDIDTLSTLYACPFICWWYATKHLVRPFRDKIRDPTLWVGSEDLVKRMHKACRKNARAWAKKPSDAVMRVYFQDELASVAAAEKRLEEQ